MTATTEQSWLVGKQADTVVVSRVRTHEARSELVHAALTGGGPPDDWQQGGYAERGYLATLTLIERLGRDPDVLIEALLWDNDLSEWCWGEVHERCCLEGFEHADDAWREGVQAVLAGRYRRPAWMSGRTWFRLRMLVMLNDAAGRDHWDAADAVEHDEDLDEESHDEGVARHMAECTRGSVGGDFHSVP